MQLAMLVRSHDMTAIASPASVQPHESEPVVGNYFVAAYPPFSCWQPQIIESLERVLLQPALGTPVGLYVHIPFCQKKCSYCYYLSYVGAGTDVVNEYVDSVVNEAALYSEKPAVQGRSVAFVYFGGANHIAGERPEIFSTVEKCSRSHV